MRRWKVLRDDRGAIRKQGFGEGMVGKEGGIK